MKKELYEKYVLLPLKQGEKIPQGKWKELSEENKAPWNFNYFDTSITLEFSDYSIAIDYFYDKTQESFYFALVIRTPSNNYEDIIEKSDGEIYQKVKDLYSLVKENHFNNSKDLSQIYKLIKNQFSHRLY